MPANSISVQVPPTMAKFIRAKVSRGDYPSPSALICDAIRRMKDADESEQPSALEQDLTKRQQRSIQLRVKQGLADLETGRYQDFDQAGLAALAVELVYGAPKKPKRTVKA